MSERASRLQSAYGELLKRKLASTKKDIAEKMKASAPNVSSAFKGDPRVLTDRFLLRFNSAFGNLFNKEWLLTGEGEMLINSDTKSQPQTSQIPLIPASAFAGNVTGFTNDSITLDKCELINSPVSGAEMAIPITGDSMEPDYPDGSIAYISRINEKAFIPWGHTVIIDTENGAFIKRIYPDEHDSEYIWAKSINPAYPPMHVPIDSIFKIFRVLAVSRIFTTM